jgi:hypothetical protein
MTPKHKHDAVISKITKLLALGADGSGATPAEREQAQRRAADLMARYQIAQLDLDDSKQGAIGEERIPIAGMIDNWRGDLPGRIAKAMGGDVYMTTFSRTSRTYHIVGRPETLAFARTLTDALIPWLEIECESSLQRALDRGVTGTCSRCDGEGETRRVKGGGYTDDLHTCPTCDGSGIVPLNRRVFRREFYDAASRTIAGRLRAQRAKTANDVGGQGKSTDLVRSDKAALERYYSDAGLTFVSRSTGTTGGAAEGRASGRDAGTRADLKPGGKVDKGRGALPAGSRS